MRENLAARKYLRLQYTLEGDPVVFCRPSAPLKVYSYTETEIHVVDVVHVRSTSLIIAAAGDKKKHIARLYNHNIYTLTIRWIKYPGLSSP